MSKFPSFRPITSQVSLFSSSSLHWLSKHINFIISILPQADQLIQIRNRYFSIITRVLLRYYLFGFEDSSSLFRVGQRSRQKAGWVGGAAMVDAINPRIWNCSIDWFMGLGLRSLRFRGPSYFRSKNLLPSNLVTMKWVFRFRRLLLSVGWFVVFFFWLDMGWTLFPSVS